LVYEIQSTIPINQNTGKVMCFMQFFDEKQVAVVGAPKFATAGLRFLPVGSVGEGVIIRSG
jgi:hypothetical protein